MRIGCCVPSAHAHTAAKLGYEFVELRVSELVPEGPVEAFATTARQVEAAGIPALAFNFFLPPELKVVGPAVDTARLRRYVATAAERAAALGGRVIVLGSGGARRIPAGFPEAEAARQLRGFLAMAGEAAAPHGVAIALEPLNPAETNLVHRVREATAHALAVGHRGVGVLADTYHMQMGCEPFEALLGAADRLLHVHVSDVGRGCPGTRSLDFWGLFTYLNAMGYEGAVSVECAFRHFTAEGGPVLAFLREAMAARGEVSFAP